MYLYAFHQLESYSIFSALQYSDNILKDAN